MELINLVINAKHGEQDALYEIVKRFQGLIKKVARTIYIRGFDEDDLISIGTQSLIIAVKTYDLNSNTRFEGYAYKVIRNNYYNEIRRIARYNHVISLNATIDEDDHEAIDIIEDNYTLEEYMDKKDILKIVSDFLNNLGFQDRELLIYYFRGTKGNIKEYSIKCNKEYFSCIRRKNKLIGELREYLKDYRK
ncbi:sigma-70 family RNA polymerase sigma factor [Clostridium hydrogeniformans]|uniref:sigma-70 family RNA polymerase sigma factor n=1 Tax=Clostridium hydrogeniformans TaxID=349933 RepID=UPI000482130F|nr:sigma-70 family RNA polymerase sigma factor [Clostridium hydrogeniformans]